MAGLINLRLLTDFFNKIGQLRPMWPIWPAGSCPLRSECDRVAALHENDAECQFRTHAPQQICELGVNTPSLLDKTQAVSCRCHQPECPLSSGYPDFLDSFLDLSNPGIDLVLSDRTHRMINDDGLKVRHAKSLSG